MDSRNTNQESEKLPETYFDELECSITSQLFLEPITTECGHTFEKEALLEFFEKNPGNHCPHCRTYVPNIQKLQKNILVCKLVDKTIKAQPELLSEQYLSNDLVDALVEDSKQNPKKIDEIIARLQENDIEKKFADGLTVLHKAIEAQNLALVKAFIEHFSAPKQPCMDFNAEVGEQSALSRAIFTKKYCDGGIVAECARSHH